MANQLVMGNLAHITPNIHFLVDMDWNTINITTRKCKKMGETFLIDNIKSSMILLT